MSAISVNSRIGGPEGIRTPDLLTASQARSQLRHGPTPQQVMIPRTSDLAFRPRYGLLPPAANT